MALNVARRLNDPDALVVTLLCDTGERYLSKLYNDEWMRENQMLDARTGDAWPVARRQARRGAGWCDQHRAGSDSAAGAAADEPARRVAAAGDGRRKLRRFGERVVAEPRARLENTKVLDKTVGDVMDSPFPIVDAGHPVDSIAKLLSKANPAVLVRANGTDARHRDAVRHAALSDGALR